ncbi:MAG TPA: hypothetical protein DEG47_27245, partial [Cyanobacteria bacterium UBA11148]|nr:hypothetical protein [Cyanobacteria bacterium UBA11148]
TDWVADVADGVFVSMGGVVFTDKLSSSSVSVAADGVTDVAGGGFVSMGGGGVTGKLSSSSVSVR